VTLTTTVDGFDLDAMNGRRDDVLSVVPLIGAGPRLVRTRGCGASDLSESNRATCARNDREPATRPAYDVMPPSMGTTVPVM
jgi:hypothetical protein